MQISFLLNEVKMRHINEPCWDFLCILTFLRQHHSEQIFSNIKQIHYLDSSVKHLTLPELVSVRRNLPSCP